jgi:hypothetical protein
MGHSPQIANKHYLHPTDADFERGAAGKSIEEAFDMPREEAAQNPAQYTHARGGNEKKANGRKYPIQGKSLAMHQPANPCTHV